MTSIYIYDEFSPEAIAMMQALYSRSSESVEKHAQKVVSSGSSKFMESYYVGYGHASIGDCGTTTLFFEGPSILAAKAIQDNPLYSGQETSTRYIDFSKQKIIDPIDSFESSAILRDWILFYVNSTEIVRAFLRERFPLKEDQSEKVWEKAIQARSFDILRGYLPAGATTQLSWSTNLRQAYDKLTLLDAHPLEEVRQIAAEALDQLSKKYPSSFSHREDIERDSYYESIGSEISYSNYNYNLTEDDFIFDSNIDNDVLEKESLYAISERPERAKLPNYITKYGRCNCTFLLDYGSFRDVQRHRNGLCRIPIINNRYGFNSWYLEQLPDKLRDAASKLIRDQFSKIANLDVSDAVAQYYYPLGVNVACELVYDLPEMVYVTELRSGSTVHPTLRKIAQRMHRALASSYPKLKLYSDLNVDVFDIKRGLQDIQKVEVI